MKLPLSLIYLKTKIKVLLFFFFLLFLLLLEYILYQLEIFEFTNKFFFLFLLFQINLLLILFLIYQIFRYVFYNFLEIKTSKLSKSIRLKLFFIYFFSIFFSSLILGVGGFYLFKETSKIWLKGYTSLNFLLKTFPQESFFRSIESDLVAKANKIEKEYINQVEEIRSKDLREKFRYFLNLDAIEVYTLEGDLFKKTYSLDILKNYGIPPSLINILLNEKRPQTQILNIEEKFYVRVFTLVTNKNQISYILTVGKIIDPALIFSSSSFPWLKFLKSFIFLSLLLIFLLVLFLGIWVGNKLGKTLVEPLKILSYAAQKIANQEYDITLPEIKEQGDELALLVRSFKEMVNRLKNLEEERTRYIQSLQAILDHLPIGIALITKDFSLSFQNKHLKKLLEDLSLKDFSHFFTMLNLTQIFQTFDLEQGFYKDFTLETIKGKIFVGLAVIPITLFQGSFYLIIIENLTEKETLKRLSLWKEVAIRIAHELKNPLTPIKLTIERLERKISPDLTPEKKDLFKQSVELILKSIEELHRLSQDLFILSQKPLVERVPSDLVVNLKEVISLYTLAYPHLNLSLKGEEKVVFSFDPIVLKRLWINLLENSVKAMQGRGDIIIEIKKKENYVEIIYTDSGEGLPEEIVLAFNHGSWEDLKRFGTGLIVIQTVIKLHRGEIFCKNLPPKGSQFFIKLPLN